MKALVICIEILIGHYFIIIYSDYIITYRVDDNSLKKLDVNVLDMNSELMYFFDNKNNDISNVSDIIYDNSNPNIALIESEKIEETDYKNFNCEVNLLKYIYNDSIPVVVKEYYTKDIPIINKYIKIDKFKQKLPYIGSSYNNLNIYILKSEEVTHSEPLLLSKFIYLKEENRLDEDLLEAIKKIKDYTIEK